MVRICNTCKKIIPSGSNHIHVTFEGKFGEKVKPIISDTIADFCSLECFDKFKIVKNKENLKDDSI